MANWEVEYTDEFGEWWDNQTKEAQVDIDTVVGLLENFGPHLQFPYSSGVSSSKHSHIRELRIQHKGAPYRILYAFDPKRIAILLLGGRKEGDDRWYEVHVPLADKLYDVHLSEITKEVKKHGQTL
jgi:hypothetical protein